MADKIKNAIRIIPDFPKPGIQFKDITPVLANHEAFQQAIDIFVARYKDEGITQVACIEARGPNQFNIVSLRTETDADVNGGGGRYDDRTALVWTDSQGRPHVEEFDSNTEPSARYRNRMGVDADGDGRLDHTRLIIKLRCIATLLEQTKRRKDIPQHTGKENPEPGVLQVRVQKPF